MKRLATPSFLNQLLVSGYQMLLKTESLDNAILAF